jgi:glycosyltransferase involved in cell wall biosynthesis
MTGDATVEVIIPVRNMAEHLRQCLLTLRPQLRDGDRITVVDDASTDGSGLVADAVGACVISQTRPTGPYLARHRAAQRSDADVLLFVDVRCRARDGLLDSHRRMLSEPGVALSCTDVETVSGGSFASEVAGVIDPFRLRAYVGVPGRMDFFPTANLGVRRSAYESVGGFRPIRSGGDADLCWRIQLSGLGRLAADERRLMGWVPRHELRQLIEQWYRYGKSSVLLERMYPPCTELPRISVVSALGTRLRGTGTRFSRLVRTDPGAIPAVAAAAALQSVHLAGRLAAKRDREPPAILTESG